MNTRMAFVVVFCVLFVLQNTECEENKSKRILLTDPDYADNQQLHKDIQALKGVVSHLQSKLSTVTTKVLNQEAEIAGLQANQQKLLLAPIGSIYIRWGRKECSVNGTELLYSGIAGGGFYRDSGRAVNSLCLPHNPDLGPISTSSLFGDIFGMEYETNAFGHNLIDKDVPCAVCRSRAASSVLMIPGKLHCLAGWKMEYQGNLMSGHYSHAGATQYICVDSQPDVLEDGARNDDGYLLYEVKAYCGSLKCPPYVQNTSLKCVVCSK